MLPQSRRTAAWCCHRQLFRCGIAIPMLACVSSDCFGALKMGPRAIRLHHRSGGMSSPRAPRKDSPHQVACRAQVHGRFTPFHCPMSEYQCIHHLFVQPRGAPRLHEIKRNHAASRTRHKLSAPGLQTHAFIQLVCQDIFST